MVPTRRGSHKLIVDQHTYVRNKSWRGGNSVHWVCSMRNRGCKATVLTFKDSIIKEKIVKIPSRYGKKSLLMINGYTFSEYSRNFWYCTKRRLGCPAKAKTSNDALQSLSENHNHTAPEFYVTKEGRYVNME
ncbi:hypothetical protein K1T71_006551 [Dendrolimus kikuchii]|uniref:Uncharacterized protein n=1 Tax=Dendrolimus kikuchii TaxID=765133 RepID=A0ACC1D1C6_9NEOP|nr:hypothetical protein K1T71_006551 [Dendrolimus kikuchii]